MSTQDKKQQVMESIKQIAETALTGSFNDFLSDEDIIEYDYENEPDPDTLTDDELPKDYLDLDMMWDALGDYWNFTGRYAGYYIYLQLDQDMRNDLDIQKFIYDELQTLVGVQTERDNASGVILKSAPQGAAVELFTGSETKVIAANRYDLIVAANDHVDYDELHEFECRVDRQS